MEKQIRVNQEKQKGFKIKPLFLALLCLTMGVCIGLSLQTTQVQPVDLAVIVQNELHNSGVTNPVTAVLLNFRSYDTLLEVGVLVLAAFSVISLRTVQLPRLEPDKDHIGSVQKCLVLLLTPVMIVIGGYLLWVGSESPGGAFQAGSVIAAALLLLLLSGYQLPLQHPKWLLRILLTFGFCVFLSVAMGTVLMGRSLIEYPSGWSGILILIIEATLTISIALILVAVVSGRVIENTECRRQNAE